MIMKNVKDQRQLPYRVICLIVLTQNMTMLNCQSWVKLHDNTEM